MLKLRHTYAGNLACVALLGAAREAHNLEEVDLTENEMGSGAAEALAYLLSSTSSIKRVRRAALPPYGPSLVSGDWLFPPASCG